MIFSVAVHGAPYGSFAHQHAQKFVEAAYAAGHEVNRVFFYHEAVNISLNSQVPLQDETDLTESWVALAGAHGFELAVCIANALKRGVLSEEEHTRYETPAATLAPGFELVGLGQLIEAMATSDRYVEFPA